MAKRSMSIIATLPRSGYTLLGMMLGNHSSICHIGESSYCGKVSPDDVMCSCGIRQVHALDKTIKILYSGSGLLIFIETVL